MAEARSEEEEESVMRDTREQVVRRQPNGTRGRPDRHKPEHRLSQGPLSSIRAVIKRTSSRSTSLSETPRDRDRDRERDRERERERERDRERDRDRRRPEITILSAEPLASSSWFPGASGRFPLPPPPPAAQIWGPTIPPAVQPPPSYEEVIREKTQEQVLSTSSSSSPAASPSRPVSTVTIATQTDPGSDPTEPQGGKPVRPPRPPFPQPPKSFHADDTASTASQSAPAPLSSDTHISTGTQSCDPSTDLCSPLTSNSSVQTDQLDQCSAAVDVAPPPPTASSQILVERPRPRPRSKLGLRPIRNEVQVQTLVKLREDGLATLANCGGSDSANQQVTQGKYLQELLEAFSSDDWGFPENCSDSGLSQSDSEEEDGEDMATLRARIQAFEQQQQQQQQVSNESCGDSNHKQSGTTKKPEPRPRPRLQGQQAKSAPPTIAPKPKNFSPGPKPSSKGFWEEGGLTAAIADSAETPSAETPSPEAQSATEPPPKSVQGLEPQPTKTTEKPTITPKPPSVTETLSPAPVPAPRPPPPKLTHSLSEPKPPPRPPIAPRASMGAPHPDKSITDGCAVPTLPPRPLMEVSIASQTENQTGSEVTQNIPNQTVKAGSTRPGVPNKPAALTAPRRASAPNLVPKPTGVSPTPPDPNPVPAKPTTAPKPSGPPAPAKSQNLAPAPAPALRKGPAIQTKAEPANAACPNSSDPPLPPRPSSVKLLPLRPPPIKSVPGRPPPPAINSTSSTSQISPPSKVTPAPSVSPASSVTPAQNPPPPSSSTANQTQTQAQRAPKRGPPLPPRPKPGHPLYSSYVKQEVLIVLDDPSPSPSEKPAGDTQDQTITPLINTSQCLLDLHLQPDQDSQSKPALEDLSLSDSESILPVQPAEQKEQSDSPPVSGPRCIALFDYEGQEEDELTFSQGDVIALLELVGQEWGRGQIHGRIGKFPLNFTEVVEPIPQPATAPAETAKPALTDTEVTESSGPKTSPGSDSEAEEWAVALFDFPGQTPEDLSFHKGALIRVMECIDAEWRRGQLEGREGLYPVAFTQPCQAQPITDQQSVAKALFDFTGESEDELTLKVGDTITQVEAVDEQWIMGVAGGKRGIVPKNYISLM